MIRQGLWRAARLAWWGCALYMLSQIRAFDAQPLQPEAPASWPLQALQLLGFLGLFWFSTAGAVLSVLLFAESAAALRRQPRSRRAWLWAAADLPPCLGVAAEVALLLWIGWQQALA